MHLSCLTILFYSLVFQAYEEEANKEIKHMKHIPQMLRLYFTLAVDKAFPGLEDFPINVTPTGNPKFGDYQCNVAPPLFAVIFSDFDELNMIKIHKIASLSLLNVIH